MPGGEGASWPASPGAGEGGSSADRIRILTIEHTIQYLGEAMPETTKMTRAWRTDSVEGPAAKRSAAWRRHSGGSGRRSPGRAWRRGRDPWAGAARFEEAVHRFTVDLAKSTDSEAIEFALVRLAGQIVPEGRVELIRATGEPACCKKWKVASQSGTFAALGEDAAGRPDVGVEEVPVRWGTASHGVLRLHVPALWGRPAIGAETRRRLTMACTLAACALENARLRAEWIWGGEHDGDEGRPDHPVAGRR